MKAIRKYLWTLMFVSSAWLPLTSMAIDGTFSVTEKWQVVVNGKKFSGTATGTIVVTGGTFTYLDKIGFPHSPLDGITGHIDDDGTYNWTRNMVYAIGSNSQGEFAIINLSFITLAINIGHQAGTSLDPNEFDISGNIFSSVTGSGEAIMDLDTS